MDQASKLPMAAFADPDEEAMAQELERLEATEKHVDLLCWRISYKSFIHNSSYESVLKNQSPPPISSE